MVTLNGIEFDWATIDPKLQLVLNHMPKGDVDAHQASEFFSSAVLQEVHEHSVFTHLAKDYPSEADYVNDNRHCTEREFVCPVYTASLVYHKEYSDAIFVMREHFQNAVKSLLRQEWSEWLTMARMNRTDMPVMHSWYRTIIEAGRSATAQMYGSNNLWVVCSAEALGSNEDIQASLTQPMSSTAAVNSVHRGTIYGYPLATDQAIIDCRSVWGDEPLMLVTDPRERIHSYRTQATMVVLGNNDQWVGWEMIVRRRIAVRSDYRSFVPVRKDPPVR